MDTSKRRQRLERAKWAALDGDPVLALRLVDELLQGTPGDCDCLVLKGNMLDMMGEYALSRPLYEEVIERDPGNIRALIDLAELDEHDGAFEKALLRLSLAETLLVAGQHYLDSEQELQEVRDARARCTRRIGSL